MRHVPSLFGVTVVGVALLGLSSSSMVACGGGFSEADGANGGGATGPGGAGSESGGSSSTTGGASAGGSQSSGGSSSDGGASTGADECSAETPCAGGVCSGLDCGSAWTCTPSSGCTKDLADYCGCDGVTFQDSGNCPTRPYSYKGACSSNPDVVDCNPAHITCLPLVAPEPCPEGKVYSVANNCHGTCVELSQCSCDVASDCPGDNACYNYSKTCGPWLK